MTTATEGSAPTPSAWPSVVSRPAWILLRGFGCLVAGSLLGCKPTAEEQWVRVITNAKPSLVVVAAATSEGPKFGSGFVVNGKGVVATNAHVVAGSSGVEIRAFGSAEAWPGQVVAVDESNDLALIRFDSSKEMPALPLEEAVPKQGEAIVALGHPQGLEASASNGIVSSVRELEGDRTLIQMTAPISKGSSGGPILNSQGWVVGVSTAFLGEGQNLNFAVPAKALARLIARPAMPRPSETAAAERPAATPAAQFNGLILGADTFGQTPAEVSSQCKKTRLRGKAPLRDEDPKKLKTADCDWKEGKTEYTLKFVDDPRAQELSGRLVDLQVVYSDAMGDESKQKGVLEGLAAKYGQMVLLPKGKAVGKDLTVCKDERCELGALLVDCGEDIVENSMMFLSAAGYDFGNRQLPCLPRVRFRNVQVFKAAMAAIESANKAKNEATRKDAAAAVK